MNENDLNNNSNNGFTYRATSNLNTAIENPQMNVNSVVGMNVQSSNFNQEFGNNVQNVNSVNNGYSDVNSIVNNNSFNDVNNVENNNSFTNNNSFADTNGSGSFVPDSNSQFINMGVDSAGSLATNKSNYEPVLAKKKNPNAGLVVTKELKAMIIVVFVLVLFLFVMPYIYNVLERIGLIVTS